jgi:hypothetical protein
MATVICSRCLAVKVIVVVDVVPDEALPEMALATAPTAPVE